MVIREEIIKRFMWGMSILDAYLHFNNVNNYTDINIISENFMLQLLNILYEYNLKNANANRQNSPGYDLISHDQKIIIQISASASPAKVMQTLSAISKQIEQEEKKKYNNKRSIKSTSEQDVNFSNYRLLFVFLVQDAEGIRKYKGVNKKGFTTPDGLQFDAESDVLDFESLIKKVNHLTEIFSENQLEKLDHFMNLNSNLFIRRIDPLETVDTTEKIICEYAENFKNPLFLHQYEGSRVTLKNLFVEPMFRSVIEIKHNPKNVVELLDRFLWNDKGRSEDQMLLIEGDAAIGKTSLISWLCYHYKELDDIGKSIFCGSKLVCVRLRELELKQNLTPKIILQYLNISNLDEFEQRFAGAVIILDGADELSMVEGVERTVIEEFLLSAKKLFKGHKIIITSRPKFINIQFLKLIPYQHYVLLHFDKSMREKWVKKYLDCGEVISESTQAYIADLAEDEADGVADTPLALYMLVACNMEKTLRNNKWVLFYEIFHKAIAHTPYNQSFVGDSSIFHPAFKGELSDILYNVIGSIAFKMFQNSSEERYFVTNYELDDIIRNTSIGSNSIDMVKKCCVLCTYWKKNTNVGALEFYHNDIRDFFFSEYIYTRLDELCNTAKGSTRNYTQILELFCEILQYGNVWGTTWEQTLMFFFLRLIYEKNSSFNSNSLCRWISGHTYIELANAMLTDPCLWGYSYMSTDRYQSIKTTFTNTILFLRTWYEAAIYEPDLDDIDLDDTDLDDTDLDDTDLDDADLNNIIVRDPELIKVFDLLMDTSILFDWQQLLRASVKISNSITISIGSRASFSDVNFRGLNLNASHFDDSIFTNTIFVNANLAGASFRNCILININFGGADLSEADFSGAIIQHCDFSSAKIDHTKFVSTRLRNIKHWPKNVSADFSKGKLTNLSWKGCNLENARLDSTKICNSDLSLAKFGKIIACTFSNCDLRRACFNGSQLDDVLFSDLSISKGNFDGAVLCNIELQKIDLSNVSFRGARLTNIIFDNNTVWERTDFFRAMLDKQLVAALKTEKHILNLTRLAN